MKNPDIFFQLCESGEQIIRTYECTHLRKIFSPITTGYLTITNKRIVFHSEGRSLTGKSILINEMPVEDATGVNSYLGASINWIQFAIFAIILNYGMSLLSGILPPFLTSPTFTVLLMFPYIFMWLLTGNLLSEQAKKRIVQSLSELAQNRIDLYKEIKNYQPHALTLFYVGLTILAWTILNSVSFSAFFRFPILAGAYFLIYLFIFGRHRVFSLAIGSRTMKGTGIYIPGDSFRSLFTADKSAAEALSAAPAADAERVAQELGALLLDITQLGDVGIDKWVSRPAR